ncbi:hypothetical protein E2562_005393 [Oryza meyeriana var. granulata]|uniref:Uncharacterized protein n=1 Tax=Oryza meyeriana var. granulata TaxID=110450 RepID=A0A6G1DDV7_9ORYZ|nr:hypothetical protein E2562_005393 [Oryza meyeriana var. granulata]
MILSLNNASRKLPAAATFDSLTDLPLRDIQLAAGSDDRLGRLLSSVAKHYSKASCSQLDYGSLRALTIPAPRLEELTSTFVDWQDAGRLDVGDLSCVRSLRERELRSHGHPIDDASLNDYAIHLLQR